MAIAPPAMVLPPATISRRGSVARQSRITWGCARSFWSQTGRSVMSAIRKGTPITV